MVYPTPLMPPLVIIIAEVVRTAGGRALLVGGCVRDSLLGLTPKDHDIEVFGIAEDAMEPLLARCGHVIRVGRSFPVWKVWTDDMGQGCAIDVTLPRREVKVGDHHTAFTVTLDPTITFEQASLRRDFTMNAIGRDPLTGELLDPHGGVVDLSLRILRHTSLHFTEDPLRVMRAAQFAARFELLVHDETIELCRQLSPEHLSSERLWEEWQKLLLRGVKPSLGLRFLQAVNWLPSELAALVGVPQDANHHPEGCAFTHTCHCVDAFAATRIGDDREDITVGLAALCHDLGKATHTQVAEDGRITAHGHEAAGEDPTRALLGHLTNEGDLVGDVVALVITHMRPTFLYHDATRGETVKMMNRSIRRLAREVRLDRLARLVWIDKAGRPPKPQVAPEADWLRERAANLTVLKEGPVPLLMGRHLIELGLTPSLQFKVILQAALDRQLDGDITSVEEAIAFAKTLIS